jgi:hypothetical protein
MFAGNQDAPPRNEKKMHDNLVKEVRHQLLLLPYYSVFDNLLYKVDGDKVTLLGQVVRPTLKSDAEHAVKEIEGVSSVDNQIQVLPPRRWTISCVARCIAHYTVIPRCRGTECPRCLRFTSL